MPEQTFDPATVQRWQQLAGHTRTLLAQWTSVSDHNTEEADAALLALKQLLAETVPKPVAEWAVSRWWITREPIDECVRAELAERRPWPSEAAKLRRELAK